MAEDAEFFADDLDVEERIGEGGGFTHAVASVRTVDNDVDDGAMTGVLTVDGRRPGDGVTGLPVRDGHGGEKDLIGEGCFEVDNFGGGGFRRGRGDADASERNGAIIPPGS